MSANNGKNNTALVPRSLSTVEKLDPGAKRVLALMVSDALAIAQKRLIPVSTACTSDEIENWYQQGNHYGYNGGLRYFNPECLKWYRKAAEQGHARAQYELGLCYYHARNEREAVNWYRKAAEQGVAFAQFCLGLCYELGEGVLKDDTEAVKWYRKASAQGGAKWFSRAAKHGRAVVQYALGECCANGHGVPLNYVEAYKWFKLAAEKDVGTATSQLASLFSTMSKEEIREGERRYAEFKVGQQT